MDVTGIPGLAVLVPPFVIRAGDETFGDDRVLDEEEEEDSCRVVEGEVALLMRAERGVVAGGLIGLKLTVTVPEPSSSSSTPSSSLLFLWMSSAEPLPKRRPPCPCPCPCPCPPKRFETNCGRNNGRSAR